MNPRYLIGVVSVMGLAACGGSDESGESLDFTAQGEASRAAVAYTALRDVTSVLHRYTLNSASNIEKGGTQLGCTNAGSISYTYTAPPENSPQNDRFDVAYDGCDEGFGAVTGTVNFEWRDTQDQPEQGRFSGTFRGSVRVGETFYVFGAPSSWSTNSNATSGSQRTDLSLRGAGQSSLQGPSGAALNFVSFDVVTDHIAGGTTAQLTGVDVRLADGNATLGVTTSGFTVQINDTPVTLFPLGIPSAGTLTYSRTNRDNQKRPLQGSLETQDGVVTMRVANSLGQEDAVQTDWQTLLASPIFEIRNR